MPNPQPNNIPPIKGNSITDAIVQKKLLDFQEKLMALQNECGIYIIPVIRWKPVGALPDLTYMTRQEYEEYTGQKVQPSPKK